MAKIGCLKPFRGTESSLANIVLEDGEIAFATDNGAIYFGDGVNAVKDINPFINTGNTDISGIGTGTITNAISTLNSKIGVRQLFWGSQVSFADAVSSVNDSVHFPVKNFIAPAMDANPVESNTQGYRAINYNGVIIASIGSFLQTGGYWSALVWRNIDAREGVYLFSQWGNQRWIGEVMAPW